jgi:hypothetical protein
MADPLSMMAVGTMVAGAATSAYAANQNAKAQRDSDVFNAGIAEQEAVVAREQAGQAAELQRRESRKVIGSMRANAGASGLTDGSMFDVLEESASMAELDRQTILYQGELKARGYQNTAALDRASGRNAIQQGQLQSASSILTGAGNALVIGTRSYNPYQPAKV